MLYRFNSTKVGGHTPFDRGGRYLYKDAHTFLTIVGFFVSRHLGLLLCNIANMKRFLPLLMLTGLLFIISCEDKDETLDCDIKATLRDYTGLDGCGFVLVLDNGEVLEMGGFDEEPDFQFNDGMEVSISYEEMQGMATICMVGPIVRIMCMDII